jgi:hypothetical protein
MVCVTFFNQGFGKPAGCPTKRALDAGDSAASQAFSPLSSFFYAQSGFCQAPAQVTQTVGQFKNFFTE